MMQLSKKYIQSSEAASHGLEVDKDSLDYPERIIQIGEGNFLRGFVDWAVHRANGRGEFKGRVVVVAPRPSGKRNIDALNDQDGLYTVWLRGLQDGITVDAHEVVTSVSRALDPYDDWEAFLECAQVRSIDIVVSNTTEAGLVYQPEPFDLSCPITSFPGKLTAYLYRRYQFFKGDTSSGMTIVPCELIEDNGDVLRTIVLRHAKAWGLPEAFRTWVSMNNRFCNTLVDRIVTGRPSNDELLRLEEQIGCTDGLVTVGEPFMLWAIEGDNAVKTKLPFSGPSVNVRVVPSVAPYRLIKVRILNGAHTSMSSIAQLAGIKTVGDAVRDELLGPFVSKIIDEEIVPVLLSDGVPESDLRVFAANTLERFQNPFIRHEVKNLSLNGLSKICVRLLPTIRDYAKVHHRAPLLMSLALSAHLILYRDAKDANGVWQIQDDKTHMDALFSVWVEKQDMPVIDVVRDLLAIQDVWGDNLNMIPGLTETVARGVEAIDGQGAKAAIQCWLSTRV